MQLRSLISGFRRGFGGAARGRHADGQTQLSLPFGKPAAQPGRRFLLSERGSIAIYFGFSAIVFIAVTGLAIDAARGYLIKARLSTAIDAAALAGGKALQTAQDVNNTKVKADALAFFQANFPQGAMGATVSTPTIVVTNNNTVVTVNATATIPTTLMALVGVSNMTTTAGAKVARATSGLDVVFSFDVSGSMCQPCSKIDALKSNATALVDSLMSPFTTGGQNQIVTVNGTNYSLLNIGVVPWSSKVNVKTYGQESNSYTVSTQSVASYTDPMGRTSGTKTVVYKASTSQVPLLYNPSGIQGGWKGCVFARYRDDGNNGNDADITLGYPVTVGTKTWPAWEPIPTDEGEGQNFSNCDAAYWNAGWSVAQDGTARPNGWPNPPDPIHSTNEDCASCPSVGILPLQTDATTVKNMINSLQAGGATDAPQGLFWAWEVLMPGDPFNEAVVNPPFQRAQAIVFMTDGQNFGSNGDAYHGWFGYSEDAATVSSKGDYTMPDGTIAKSNLNNRLLALAQKIKGNNPQDASAVKIYVIQYTDPNPTLTTLLQSVATTNAAPYYYYAPDSSALSGIFDQIAASLSALRIVQ
jgi:Flp pilus assembly protein TadG